MAWTLEHAGTTKPFHEWGFANLQRRLVSAGIDVATFDHPVQAFDADTVLQPDATVKIYRDGVKWFEGVVTQTPLTALPTAEFHGYVVSGPWYHFENNTYKQPWLDVGGQVNIGHIIMNLTVGPALLPINLQMENICDWIIGIFGASPPFQKGTIQPVAYPPLSEVNGITCAAAMRSQLRWAPDAVVWFDYSTSPPTIHVKQRSQLTGVTIPIPDQDMSACSIVPRYDLIRPSVSIHYERVGSVNGQNRLEVVFDTWPLDKTGDEPGALNLPMSLQGPIRNVSFASLLCETIDTNSVGWWQDRIPGLKDARIANISIASVTRKLDDDTDSQALPRELLEGQITDWMNFDWERETISAKITYELYDKAASDPSKITLGKLVEQTHSVQLIATDAVTDDYQNVTTSDTGDPLPVGMAQFLYEALSVLHYDGTFRLVEEEVTGQVGMGNVVNLSGGRAAWTTMNALVQSITEDVDSGSTQVVIGPPKHLGHDDLMELLRVGRRFRWTQAATQENGELGDSGLIKLGKPTANRNTVHGEGRIELQRVQDSAVATNVIKQDAPNKVVTIEQTNGRNVSIALPDIPASVPQLALPIKIRECEVCVNNVTMRMAVLASAPYPAPP